MKNRNVLRLLVLVMALVMTLVVASCNKPTDTDGTTTEAPHEHAFDAGKVTKEATCTEKGVKTFTCACGETKTEEIKALGHNTEGTVAHKDATCTEAGVEGGTYCTRCNDGKAAAEATIEALGHNTDGKIDHVDATCTTAGVVGGTYCTVCDDGKAAAEATIEALGHNTDGKIDHVDATCTTAGVVGGTYCTACDEGKAAAEATIEALGHNTDGKIDHVDATCTATGVQGGTYCTRCNEGKAAAEAVLSLVPHNTNGSVAHVESTCSVQGVTGGTYCDACDYGKDAAEAKLPLRNHKDDNADYYCDYEDCKAELCPAHDFVIVDETPATCLATGLTAGEQCTVCGHWKVEQTITPALGHNEDGVVDHKEATCTETGVQGGTYCTRCNEGKVAAETVLPLAPHTMDGVVDHKDATCIATGVQGGAYCTVCEYGKAAAETVLPLAPHTMDGVVDHKDATCTETGVQGGTYCTVCNEGKEAAEAVLPLIDHAFAEGKCTVCGADDPDYIPPHDHVFVGQKCKYCEEKNPDFVSCEGEHVYADRFEKKWGICTVCGYVNDNHEHSIKDGECVYCDYKYEAFEVPSTFNNEVYYFAAALPEEFTGEDVIWIDAFNDALKDGNHMEYDEIRAGSGTLPYPHVYCYDESDDTLIYTINVEKAGIYNVAVHYRIKDAKTRGAKFVVNEGTENEQVINHTYGWASNDEAFEGRNNDFLIGSYMTGLNFTLQAGENTITIRVADGVQKSQHFRDLYLVLVEEFVCEHDWADATCTAPKTCSKCGATDGAALGHTEGTEVKYVCGVCNEDFRINVDKAIEIGMTYEKGKYGSDYYYVTLEIYELNTTAKGGFARAKIAEGLYVTVAGFLDNTEDTPYKVGDTVTFKAKLGAANSGEGYTTGGKELRLYEVAYYEIAASEA